MQAAVPPGSSRAAGRNSVALDQSVLVLNRNYMAIHVISARRAFVLVFRDLAEVIHVAGGHWANYDFAAWREISYFRSENKQPDEDWVKAIDFEIQVPRVIRLFTYDRVPRQNLRFNRRNLFARDDHRCQYCGRDFPTHQLSIDHVLPRSRGGPTTWENVVTSCFRCNVHKGGRTPQEARMKLMSKPSRPRHNPLLAQRLHNPKYESWKSFIDSGSVTVDVGRKS